MTALPTISPATAARVLLTEHHPALAAPVPVEHIALQAGYRIGRKRHPSSVAAFFYGGDGAPVLGINLRLGARAQRVAIAHVLGHGQLLALPLLICHEIGPEPGEAADRSTPSRQMEARANRFAAELLMPAETVHAEVREWRPEGELRGSGRLVAHLAARFQVPAPTAARRLADLGLALM